MKISFIHSRRKAVSKKLSQLFSYKSCIERKSRWLRLFPRFFSVGRLDTSSDLSKSTAWLQRLFLQNNANSSPTKLNASLRGLLSFEPLEDRAMLATFVVDTANDVVAPTDGLLSLREAIVMANTTAGADEITFDASLAGLPINLTLGEFEITDGLSIIGLGADQTTIDAGGNSRIFNITADSGDFLFQGMTLTGGFADTDGGAISSLSSRLLTINSSTISGNSTAGTNSSGGGIYAKGDVSITGSTISGNTA